MKLCPDCRTRDRRPCQGYCLVCHAARMRAWRRTHPLTGEARRRANARSYAKVYLRRGKIAKQPCEVCGSPRSQMHHDDYGKPTEVRWFCREHHLELHLNEGILDHHDRPTSLAPAYAYARRA